MKNLIKLKFVICRIEENSFLNDAVLTSNGIQKEDSTCIELKIYHAFDTKLEALEYLANSVFQANRHINDFIILEKYTIVKVESKEDK